MVTSEFNGNVQARDANDGRPVGQPIVHLRASGAAPRPIFSRDGQTILTAGGRYIHAWDRDNRRNLKTLVLDDIGGDAVRSPTISLWQVGEPTASTPDNLGLDSYPDQAPFETDGVATLLLNNRRLVIRDTSSGRSLDGPRNQREFGRYGQLFSFEPAGSNLLLSSTPASFLNPLFFDLELWSLEPVEGDPKLVRLWAEILSRAEVSDGDNVSPLDEIAWETRRRGLQALLQSAPQCHNLHRIATDHLYWLRCEADLAEQTHRWESVRGS